MVLININHFLEYFFVYDDFYYITQVSHAQDRHKMINTMNLSDAAKSLYEKKYLFPESKLAQRCLDYKALEKYAKKWKTKE